MKKFVVALMSGVLVLGATGCARRQIDADKTGSVDVPGTNGSLKKFCDGSLLIYWNPSITSGEDDEYDFYMYEGCTPDGKILNGAGRIDINPGTPQQAPSQSPAKKDAQQDDED